MKCYFCQQSKRKESKYFFSDDRWYRLKIEMPTDRVYLHYITHESCYLTRNNTQMRYINAGLLLYQSILLCNTICLRFDEYFRSK